MEDRTPMQSKKFIAYMVAELGWKAMAFAVLLWGKDSMQANVFVVLLTIIVIAGFLEVGYILGQASLDKYLRLAKMASDTGSTFNTKGFKIGPPKSNDITGDNQG